MIAHNKPYLGQLEQKAAAEVIASGWVAPGPQVEAFENEFCQWVGLDEGHAVAVSSGTSALFLTLQALGVLDKQVLTPVYGCAALPNAVLMAGANPHYCDNHSGSVLTNYAKPSDNIAGSIIQHTYGFVSPVNSESRGFTLEDCCQSLGARVAGSHVGLNGDAGVFSFYATKMITSGGHGGMVISKNISLIDEIRDYLDFDCRNDFKPRFNFQMTDLQAAVGRVQLQKLPTIINRRAAIFAEYQATLPMLDSDVAQANDATPVRYRALIEVADPGRFIDKMSAQGVRCINPLLTEELLAKDTTAFVHAKATCRRFVSIPVYPGLTDEQVQQVIKAAELSL